MYESFTAGNREILFLEKSESTNSDMKKRIYEEKAPLFAVISAREQSGGRGRLGRSFFSPGGGLYFSVSVPLTGKENNIPFMTLLAGLCVSEAIYELTGVRTQIKWPNDIYFGNKKLGGILCELVTGGCVTAVVGIGINLTLKKEDIPTELINIMTSFCAEGLSVPDEKMLIKSITERLDKYIYEYKELYEVREETITAIRRLSYSIGKNVKYKLGDTVYEGLITNIMKTGAAQMTLPDGTVKEIFCGEITQ